MKNLDAVKNRYLEEPLDRKPGHLAHAPVPHSGTVQGFAPQRNPEEKGVGLHK